MTAIELLDELKVEHASAGESHHVRFGWIGFDCPRCSPGSGSFKLGISLTTSYSRCWSCGPIPLAAALVELTGKPWGQIKELIGKLDREPRVEADAPLPGRLVLPSGLEPLGPRHRKYLAARKLDPDECAGVWNMQGIGLAARLAWRVFVPIINRGRTISWTTRSTGDDPARYVSAKPDEEALPAKSVLFGQDLTRHAAIIVEGPLSAVRIGPGAVATLGLAWTRPQLLAMSRFPVRTVCFDNESAAQRRADELCAALAAFPGRTLRAEIDASDPGDASDREVRWLRRRFLR